MTGIDSSVALPSKAKPWSPSLRVLFAAFAIYLTFPIIETPVFGLSLSAPVFALIALEVWSSRQPLPSLHWLLLAGLFLGGCFVSITGNVLVGALAAVELDEALMLVRFAYWTLVFVTTASVVSRSTWAPSIPGWLAAGITGLAALRLAEVYMTGVWGGRSSGSLSQNDYGFAFSTFTPFLMWIALGSSPRRIWAVPALALTLAAAAANGSRSSWLAIALAAVVLTAFALAAGRLRAPAVIGVALVSAIVCGALILSPAAATHGVGQRWSTFANLDADKPFQSRLRLARKGWELFRSSPLIGVGLGRFTKEDVSFRGDRGVAWASEASLNQRTPHNAYIKVLAETGLAGATPLAALLLALGLLGPPAALRLAGEGQDWAIPAYAAVLALSLHLVALSGLTGTAPWFAYGLVAAAIDRDRRSRFAHPARY